MKRTKLLIGSMILALIVLSCKGTSTKPQRTQETEALLRNLKKIDATGFMFGHHDDPVYGIGWNGDENRSDVRSVCGDYPAVISFDLGRIELGGDRNLDKVSFERIRKEVINQYNRGGVSSFSWHLDNPVTGRDSWDVSDTTVVEAILSGGAEHEKFLKWLDIVAAFINSIETEQGVKVPILFRPWHEHTGSWFWWGENLCSAQQYKDLWRMTYNRIQEKGVTNALYAYSPGVEPKDSTQYLARYPGDDLIDLIGFDAYQFDRAQYIEQLNHSLAILTQVGKAHNKAIAITETGFEAIPDSTWWTETLLPVVRNYPISYVLVWRNAWDREKHYYAPYPGQVSASDFVVFCKQPKTLFAADVKNLYSTNDKNK